MGEPQRIDANMAVFHQMGHHSNNLIDLPEMSAYTGAIFSPINSKETELREQIEEVRAARKEFEVIFDPQLYVPATSRGELKKWSYFPKDVDTADLSSAEWWTKVISDLGKVCDKIKTDAVCSPCIIPKTFDDRYYSLTVNVANELRSNLARRGTQVLQTVLVGLPDVASASRAMEIASIVSRTEADRVYLILVGSTPPRNELADVDELTGAMQLINALERNHVPVLVAFCGSEILLWKAAGAGACAAGKFFNLRRFTRQRFEEPGEAGGGQLPYWFEEGLLAFLRQADLIRVRRLNLTSEASQRNPFCSIILQTLEEAAREKMAKPKWLAAAWRQFLYWFSDVEGRLDRNPAAVEPMLKVADANWAKLDQAKVLMEDRRNDGTWVRSWLNALSEYETEKSSALKQ
jgi:hypothetical protein